MSSNSTNPRRWFGRPGSQMGPRHPISGRHVLAAMMAFFGVVFAVNGVMAYSALSTFSGLDGDDAYRRGLAYNATVAEAEQQERLGWTASLQLQPDVLRVRISNKAGQPATHLSVSGMLGRPATDRQDQPMSFLEVGPGIYEAPSGHAGPGSWIASILAVSQNDGGAGAFRLKERLWLIPKQ